MNKKIVTSIILCSLALSLCSVLVASSVRADSSEAKILSYSWYVAGSNNELASYPGDLVVVGEVQNIGTNTLAYVNVGVTVFNSTGDFLASSGTTAFVNDLLAGQKAPFYIDLSVDSGSTGDLSWVPLATNITVLVSSAQDTTDSQYQDLSVTSSSHSIDANGLYTVTGAVTNTGAQTSGPLWVVATFYNSSGTVVSVDYTNVLAQSLPVGSSLPFTVVPVDNNIAISSQITSFSLLIQSRPLIASSPTPTPPMTSSPTPTSSTTSQPTVTTPHATATNIYTITDALAVIIAVAIVVIVVLLIIKRNKSSPVEIPPSTPQSTESPSQNL